MAILGIDEVGRGPLAGPLVVGAVVLPGVGSGRDDGSDYDGGSGDDDSDYDDGRPEWVAELRDSKKLTAKKRAALSEIIWREAPAAGLGWVTPVEIDELGMSEALRLATRRAVEEVQKCIARRREDGGFARDAEKARGEGAKSKRVAGERVGFDQIVIDGKVNFLAGTKLEKYVSTAVKADDLVKEVSAASIIANQARDAYMIGVGERYPEYGFEKHMGYGTAAHMKAIREYGATPEHRRSFAPIAEMTGFARPEKAKKNTTKIGLQGEMAAGEFLEKRGHRVLARNFKTYYYEIDIVSECAGRVYFTEVKTRRDEARGGGLAAVDERKLGQMRYAAECYLHYRGLKCDASLAVAAVRYDARSGECIVEKWVEV